uniref:Uncharacterized protein n=1 Tax=Anguilla anguilla TaxID=7936 RepID=A0A0E9T934_ANGAN
MDHSFLVILSTFTCVTAHVFILCTKYYHDVGG